MSKKKKGARRILSVDLPADTERRLIKFADREKRAKSNLALVLIEDGLAKREQETPELKEASL